MVASFMDETYNIKQKNQMKCKEKKFQLRKFSLS